MSENQSKIKIGVVDDHNLFRQGLIQLIQFLGEEYCVIITASNGKDLLEKLNPEQLPDLLLLDIEMPIMNGYETAKILKTDYPSIKVITITMNEEETSLIQMLKLGVRGFLNKDIDPNELKRAMDSVISKGYHYTDRLTGRLISMLQNDAGQPRISKNEQIFITLACSEDPYKVIADKMCLSIKTIDGYRASLFEKLNVKSRVGLVMYAIKNKMVKF
ncbi:MAG: two-component system invasion response regulator UvrY [Crocinitomix sp.]|jgi:two-component system invasion response regulator UvrY